jgi:hypothetical protein
MALNTFNTSAFHKRRQPGGTKMSDNCPFEAVEYTHDSQIVVKGTSLGSSATRTRKCPSFAVHKAHSERHVSKVVPNFTWKKTSATNCLSPS